MARAALEACDEAPVLVCDPVLVRARFDGGGAEFRRHVDDGGVGAGLFFRFSDIWLIEWIYFKGATEKCSYPFPENEVLAKRGHYI